MQRSTIKTAINIMIYGVTIVLNDCNFSLKNREQQVKERYSFEAFFTNKTQALSSYEWQLQRVKNEIGVCYGRYELRGRCEFYKASIQNGKIMNYGETIKSQKI